MDESILITIKKMLGIDSENTDFDFDIMMCINMALLNLLQLGIGPEEGFAVTSADQVWSDFLSDSNLLLAVPTYIHLKVKMIFDQQSMSSIMRDMCQAECEQLEWRMREQAEYAASLKKKEIEEQEKENGDD